MSTANEELLKSVIEITGANTQEAQHLLAACGNNVETAVALYFEQGVSSASPTVTPRVHSPINVEEDTVRAPIAPIREQLLGPEDDNFIQPSAARLVRLPQRVKVCPLRDFAREGALLEEQLQAAAGDEHTVHPNQNRRRISRLPDVFANASTAERITNSRLGDLFRPPTDIAYASTFASARARATEQKEWLLVNVQSDNFNSQLLNRDVWSNKAMRKLLRKQFVLWQVDSESSEGRRFVAFYHCGKLPYICVIDPRTGEEMWKSTSIEHAQLLNDLQIFIREHRDFANDDAPSTSKRSAECIAIDDDDDSQDVKVVTPSPTTAKKRSKLLDMSEEEQIALAIRNSMRENNMNGAGNRGDDSDDDVAASDTNSLEEFTEEDAQNVCEKNYEEYLGENKDELTMLKLRLVNAEGTDEVLQLRWPSDTRLQILRMYIGQTQAHLQQKSYKLILAYPRKTLEGEHDLQTLKELGLHPSANIHVSLD